MRAEWVALPLLVVLFITKFSLAVSDGQRLLQASDEDEIFRSNFNPTNGRNSMGIPFRPVRRIGSEFLGKRSEQPHPYVDESLFEPMEDKRALGSEFLGKRRLGSEFLGKRSSEPSWDGESMWGGPLNALATNENSLDKRASPSQYVARRRLGPWGDWTYKRGLGSEFLGKRVLGSEFLGKRSPTSGQNQLL